MLLWPVLDLAVPPARISLAPRPHRHPYPHAGSPCFAPPSQAAAPAAWLDALLAWRAARIQAMQVTAVFRHAAVALPAHHHEGLERHRHGPDDATVQAMDSAGDDAGQANAANPAPAWGPTAEYRVPPSAPAGVAWPGLPQPAWSSAPTRLPERPPRA